MFPRSNPLDFGSPVKRDGLVRPRDQSSHPHTNNVLVLVRSTRTSHVLLVSRPARCTPLAPLALLGPDEAPGLNEVYGGGEVILNPRGV